MGSPSRPIRRNTQRRYLEQNAPNLRHRTTKSPVRRRARPRNSQMGKKRTISTTYGHQSNRHRPTLPELWKCRRPRLEILPLLRQQTILKLLISVYLCYEATKDATVYDKVIETPLTKINTKVINDDDYAFINDSDRDY